MKIVFDRAKVHVGNGDYVTNIFLLFPKCFWMSSFLWCLKLETAKCVLQLFTGTTAHALNIYHDNILEQPDLKAFPDY